MHRKNANISCGFASSTFAWKKQIQHSWIQTDLALCPSQSSRKKANIILFSNPLHWTLFPKSTLPAPGQCYRTCDFSIGGIYMWVDYFGYEYCIFQDTLFIKGGEEDNLQNTAFAVARRQIESARIPAVTERVLPPTQRPVHFVCRTRTSRTGNSTTLRLPDNRIARLGRLPIQCRRPCDISWTPF